MIAYCISRRQEPYDSNDYPIGWFAIDGLCRMGSIRTSVVMNWMCGD